MNPKKKVDQLLSTMERENSNRPNAKNKAQPA